MQEENKMRGTYPWHREGGSNPINKAPKRVFPFTGNTPTTNKQNGEVQEIILYNPSQNCGGTGGSDSSCHEDKQTTN